MIRTAWLQDRRTQKFCDVLNRWERKELSAQEAGFKHVFECDNESAVVMVLWSRRMGVTESEWKIRTVPMRTLHVIFIRNDHR